MHIQHWHNGKLYVQILQLGIIAVLYYSFIPQRQTYCSGL